MCVCMYVSLCVCIHEYRCQEIDICTSRCLCVLSLYEFIVLFKQHMKLHLHLKTEPRCVYILGNCSTTGLYFLLTIRLCNCFIKTTLVGFNKLMLLCLLLLEEGKFRAQLQCVCWENEAKCIMFLGKTQQRLRITSGLPVQQVRVWKKCLSLCYVKLYKKCYNFISFNN